MTAVTFPDLVGEEVEKEPALLLDGTGSMDQPVAPGSPVTKRMLAHDILLNVVTGLAESDTAGHDETGGGGVITYTFADGAASELGDLNPTNFEAKWRSIRWGGGTYIMPAFKLLGQGYNEEFGVKPADQQPKLITTILTDGDLMDLNNATRFLSANAQGNLYFYILITGYGPGHDRGLAQWQNLAATNTHVIVESVGTSTDAQAIADKILAMVS